MDPYASLWFMAQVWLRNTEVDLKAVAECKCLEFCCGGLQSNVAVGSIWLIFLLQVKMLKATDFTSLLGAG